MTNVNMENTFHHPENMLKCFQINPTAVAKGAGTPTRLAVRWIWKGRMLWKNYMTN